MEFIQTQKILFHSVLNFRPLGPSQESQPTNTNNVMIKILSLFVFVGWLTHEDVACSLKKYICFLTKAK